MNFMNLMEGFETNLYFIADESLVVLRLLHRTDFNLITTLIAPTRPLEERIVFGTTSLRRNDDTLDAIQTTATTPRIIDPPVPLAVVSEIAHRSLDDLTAKIEVAVQIVPLVLLR
jgi:hypothetical protein